MVRHRGASRVGRRLTRQRGEGWWTRRRLLYPLPHARGSTMCSPASSNSPLPPLVCACVRLTEEARGGWDLRDRRRPVGGAAVGGLPPAAATAIAAAAASTIAMARRLAGGHPPRRPGGLWMPICAIRGGAIGTPGAADGGTGAPAGGRGATRAGRAGRNASVCAIPARRGRCVPVRTRVRWGDRRAVSVLPRGETIESMW